MRRRWMCGAAVILVASVTPLARAAAQAPGYAEVTSPADGASLRGLISIQGSADHPAFLRYDLAFAYDPNPAGTWFPIGEPVDTRARQAALGLWDTTDLSPGVYQLRLRVFVEGGAVLEDISTGLRIGLPAAAAAQLSGSPAPKAATSTPEPTTVPIAPVEQIPAAPSDPMLLALGIGGAMAAALLLILAAFLPLRRGLALWAGNLRMRRVLRYESRRRRAEREAR